MRYSESESYLYPVSCGSQTILSFLLLLRKRNENLHCGLSFSFIDNVFHIPLNIKEQGIDLLYSVNPKLCVNIEQ